MNEKKGGGEEKVEDGSILDKELVGLSWQMIYLFAIFVPESTSCGEE